MEPDTPIAPLEERRDALIADYRVVNRQISNALEADQKERLKRQAADMLAEWREINTEIARLRRELAGSPSPIDAFQANFPFTNRQDELELLLDHYAPANAVIDAPAGYGKTALLRQLQTRFARRNWHAVYVPVGGEDTLQSIALTIADALPISTLYTKLQAMPAGCRRLSSALSQYWPIAEANGVKGVVFLIDVVPGTRLNLLEKLLTEFLPTMRRNLNNLTFFRQNHNPFRVILAGRYLTSGESRDLVTHDFLSNVTRLSPFSYRIVRDSARNYLDNFVGQNVDQLAAHLTFLTGGHPGCIAAALQLYRQTAVSADEFLAYYENQVWEEITNGYIEDVYVTIHADRDILEKLSFFRYVDYEVMEAFIQQHHLPYDSYKLSDMLTKSYLLNWEDRFLKDDMVRRLIAIKMRRQDNAQFVRYSQQAQQIYEAQLLHPGSFSPIRWTIEYLFQVLQQHTAEIHDPAARNELADNFFSQHLPHALDRFVRGLELRRIEPARLSAERDILKRNLSKDWEFQFTVNYYLRTNAYSQEPYQKLLASIDRFFADNVSNGS